MKNPFHKKILRRVFFWSIIFFFFFGCASPSEIGGVEAGNPTTPDARQVTGSVAPQTTDANSTAYLVTNNCVADTITTTDESREEVSANIDADCSFTIELEVKKAYSFSFTKEEVWVGTLYFEMDAEAFITPYLYLSDEEGVLDLGLIEFNGATATAAQEPATQQDNDDDGIVDIDDSDDNADTLVDIDQTDCDLDGIWDIYDSDTASCSEDGSNNNSNGNSNNATTTQILEVDPKNNAGLLNANLEVESDTVVRARFNCVVDTDSVTAETFQIADDDGNNLDCDYTISTSGKTVTCNHSDDFNLATTYTATIGGVTCDGVDLDQPISWSWLTVALSLDLF